MFRLNSESFFWYIIHKRSIVYDTSNTHIEQLQTKKTLLHYMSSILVAFGEVSETSHRFEFASSWSNTGNKELYRMRFFCNDWFMDAQQSLLLIFFKHLSDTVISWWHIFQIRNEYVTISGFVYISSDHEDLWSLILDSN